MSLPTAAALVDRKSTRLNSSHANISPLSLPDALAIPRSTTCPTLLAAALASPSGPAGSSTCHEPAHRRRARRSEEHTSELQSRQYLPSFPTRRSRDPPKYNLPDAAGSSLSQPIRPGWVLNLP